MGLLVRYLLNHLDGLLYWLCLVWVLELHDLDLLLLLRVLVLLVVNTIRDGLVLLRVVFDWRCLLNQILFSVNDGELIYILSNPNYRWLNCLVLWVLNGQLLHIRYLNGLLLVLLLILVGDYFGVCGFVLDCLVALSEAILNNLDGALLASFDPLVLVLLRLLQLLLSSLHIAHLLLSNKLHVIFLFLLLWNFVLAILLLMHQLRIGLLGSFLQFLLLFR